MRRSLRPLAAAVLLVAATACSDRSGDGSSAEAESEEDRTEREDPGPRFCDVYLDYLADSTPENLTRVDEAADDTQVSEYASLIASDADLDTVLAATLDLDELARGRCQPEWTAGAQGAGSTAAAAQAFLDALVAGDPSGALNVASSNAIAVFEPWEPLTPDADAGTPTIADVGGQSFSLVLGPASVAQCEVETGVVVACQLTD
jgi:hypothetical protein